MLKLEDAVAALAARAGDDPRALLVLAHGSMAAGRTEQAIAQARRAMALCGNDSGVMARARQLLNATVPLWHFPLVRDHVRNDAYEAALARAIKPGMRVLEIGTGTGILAMMAARLGAAQVITCEVNPLVAEAARTIIAANGYDDRVKVIAKRSDTLDVEADLGGPMDLLVSEIISDSVLAEGVLPAHAHACRALLKPGAPVIPARGQVRVAPVYLASDEGVRMGKVSGFDLSAFNALLVPRQVLRDQDRRELVLRSDPVNLFEFDFARPTFNATGRATHTVASLGGRINGLAQWIHLDLDDETRYENNPEAAFLSSWTTVFYALPEPMETRAGHALTIGGWHNDSYINVWLDAGEGEYKLKRTGTDKATGHSGA